MTAAIAGWQSRPEIALTIFQLFLTRVLMELARRATLP
jgi:hypothetical protein